MFNVNEAIIEVEEPLMDSQFLSIDKARDTAVGAKQNNVVRIAIELCEEPSTDEGKGYEEE